MDNPPEAPSIARVLKHNRRLLIWHIATRLALAVVLLALPFLAALAGWVAILPFFSLPVGLSVLISLGRKLAHGSRFKVCKKVLHTYPLEYRTRVTKKGSEWRHLGDVHTVRLSVRGQHGAPYLRAINASTARRWPKGAEKGGAWFAGDLAFGGVMVVPGSNDMLFVQPAWWGKYAQERDQADPQRKGLAEQAGITRMLEREPRIGA